MSENSNEASHPFLGVILSTISATLVGSSFILQKKGYLSLSTVGQINSDCFKQFYWWLGMFFMGLGETINFFAYTIAPAILITPLGAFRVIVSAVLSSIFLKEKLNKFGKLGVCLSMVGSIMIIIHAPQQEKINSFNQLVDQITKFGFSIYCAILIISSLYLAIKLAPRYGRSNVLVYMTICNMVGSLTVLCGKGLGIAAKDVFRINSGVVFHPMFWLLIAGNIFGVSIQLIYLNRALALFEASTVTPLQYVFTNLFLVYGSMLLFDEFAYLSATDCVGIACGFATVIVGVVLLSSKKDSGEESSRIKLHDKENLI